MESYAQPTLDAVPYSDGRWRVPDREHRHNEQVLPERAIGVIRQYLSTSASGHTIYMAQLLKERMMEGNGTPAPYGPSDFLNLFVSNKHMEDKVQGIDDTVKEMIKEQRENRINKRDVIGWVIGSVALFGAMCTGLLYLINGQVGSKVDPLQAQHNTLEKTVFERFQTQGEVFKSIRDQQINTANLMGELRVTNARLEAAIEEMKQERIEDHKRLDDLETGRHR